MPGRQEYHPLLDTFRLYAGWLFACLALVFAAGSYQSLRAFPVRFAILDEWVDSSMLLHATLVTFLFLLLSSVHRMMGRGVWKGVALTVLGFGLLVMFRMLT